ncbi:transposase [Limnoraphis robusta]|uniref:Transposase n=1 Tax=Limnoraphis robusta CCNP1315 TaxID=3110306 RepID=A0ABU5U0M1_9CYAN|nr:transposase [Limnoraphis robusta]MEA5500324.1 transposase [Limnoraphis robusta BA-68 BA1]MEA5520461.1 transposase [Limnoraphis robusta CCNP1315]MEA5546605.1 transposase [Limnoraphis robusta CCNP1324]
MAPKSGESFFLEFSHLDGDCFQIFLDHLSQSYPSYQNIIQLDNGLFHAGSKLKIPDNILLIFQPPYSHELNPIERVWHYFKQHLRWEIYQDLEQLKDKVRSVIEGFSPEIIASLTGWDYILEALATVA